MKGAAQMIHEPNVGQYYEEFAAGDIYKHWPGRTISEADNTWFTLVTMNTHPVHFDQNYAKDQMFGRCLVNSCLTLSMVAGMSVRETSQNAIANLGWTDIQLPNPVFVGDTIYAETEIVSKRESKSRPDAGIVSVETRAFNQNGALVMRYSRTFMIKRRGYDDDRLPRFGAQVEK